MGGEPPDRLELHLGAHFPLGEFGSYQARAELEARALTALAEELERRGYDPLHVFFLWESPTRGRATGVGLRRS